MEPKVCIVYVPFNMERFVPAVVRSWENLDYPKESLAIVIVPNGSPDGTVDYLKEKVLPRSGVDLPQTVLLNDGINHGFAGGHNLGIKWAIENNFDYVFLNNGDLRLDRSTIKELVDVMEANKSIGSAQSFIKLWDNEDVVNTTGGVIHIAGYGFARDNGKQLEEVIVSDHDEISYASGAAVMYRSSVLKEVGFLEEGFFMYHEDLELGLRIKLAGYKNVLAKKSQAFHYYEFGRNKKMFQWIETYRWDVLLTYFKIPSLIILSPLLVAIELGVWILSIKGGWFWLKLAACFDFWSPKNLRLIMDMRCRSFALRAIDDKDWLNMVTGRIEDQGQESEIMNLINPIIDFIWRVLRKLIVW